MTPSAVRHWCSSSSSNSNNNSNNSSSYSCFFFSTRRYQKRRKPRRIKILNFLLVAVTAIIPLIVLSIPASHTQQASSSSSSQEGVAIGDHDVPRISSLSLLAANHEGGAGGKVQKSASSSTLLLPREFLTSRSHHHLHHHYDKQGPQQEDVVMHDFGDPTYSAASAASSTLFVPLLQDRQHISSPPPPPPLVQQQLPVVLYPYVTMGSMGRQDATVALDGLLESPLVTLISNLSATTLVEMEQEKNVVWVADQGAARAPLPIWCRNFVQVIKDVQRQHQQQQSQQEQHQQQQQQPPVLFSWPVHIVQVSSDSTSFSPCKAATEKLLQPQHVSFFKRSMIVDRYWNESLQWVNTGRFLQNTYTQQGVLHHLGMPVRTDIVQALESHLLLADNSNNSSSSSSKMTLASAIEELPRNTDVAHFWPLHDSRVDEVNRDDGRLRDAVSHAIADLHNATIPDRSSDKNSNIQHSRRRALRLFVDTVGAGREEGRHTVQVEYVRQLLDTKIVVVAQRDGWEDHYR
jgi:hypothetical protein